MVTLKLSVTGWNESMTQNFQNEYKEVLQEVLFKPLCVADATDPGFAVFKSKSQKKLEDIESILYSEFGEVVKSVRWSKLKPKQKIQDTEEAKADKVPSYPPPEMPHQLPRPRRKAPPRPVLHRTPPLQDDNAGAEEACTEALKIVFLFMGKESVINRPLYGDFDKRVCGENEVMATVLTTYVNFPTNRAEVMYQKGRKKSDLFPLKCAGTLEGIDTVFVADSGIDLPQCEHCWLEGLTTRSKLYSPHTTKQHAKYVEGFLNPSAKTTKSRRSLKHESNVSIDVYDGFKRLLDERCPDVSTRMRSELANRGSHSAEAAIQALTAAFNAQDKKKRKVTKRKRSWCGKRRRDKIPDSFAFRQKNKRLRKKKKKTRKVYISSSESSQSDSSQSDSATSSDDRFHYK